MLKERINSWQKRLFIGIAIIALILSFVPTLVQGTSNATNGTIFNQTTTSWVERANLSLTTTSSGNIFVTATMEARTNFSTSRAGVRLRIDSIEISRVNLTEFTYQFNLPIVGFKYMASGTHYVTLETSAPAGYKLYVNNWTMFTYDLSVGAGGGAVDSVICSPSGVLDCTGTNIISIVFSPTGTNFTNASISTHNSQISSLQQNDTTDRLYANTTFIPKLNASTCASGEYSRWNGTGFACFTDDGGSGTVTSVTAVSPLTYSGTSTVVVFDNRTFYPNSSLTTQNFNAWNATYNLSYNALNNTVNNNLINWNSTSNTTTDAVNIQQNTSISNLQNVDTAQNRSFQNGSFAFVLTNGTNAIATGYYPGEPEIPDSITIDRLSLQGVTGAMNVSLLYSATSSPTYPANSVATISSATTLTGLSISAVQYSNMSVYVINNTGNVNKTTLRVHYRRVIQ